MSSIYHARSTDAGTSWGTAVVVAEGSWPSLAYHPSGLIVCGYEDSGTCYCRESTDQGATWSAAFGSQAGELPFMWYDPKGAFLYRVYYNSGDTTVKFQFSSDTGETWSSAVTVATPGEEVQPWGVSLADGRPQVIWLLNSSWYQYRNPEINGGGSWAAVP